MEHLRNLSVRASWLLAALFVLLFSWGVYYLSPDSRARILEVKGNYIYSDQQILSMAGISTATRLWLVPDIIFENRLAAYPLIESSSIQRDGQKLTVAVQEADVIGYVVKDGQNLLLTLDGRLVPLDQEHVTNLVRFPLLTGFSDEQLSKIAAAFSSVKKYMNNNLISQISEITPYQFSYDENGVQITMNDGNVVFSALADLGMMVRYEAMLTNLQGNGVCLLLNNEQSTIQTGDCSYLKLPLDQRIAWQESVRQSQEQASEQSQEQAGD